MPFREGTRSSTSRNRSGASASAPTPRQHRRWMRATARLAGCRAVPDMRRLPTNRSQHFAQPSFKSTIFKGGFERQAVQGSRRGAMKPYWEERVRWPRSPMRKSRGYACGPRGASSYVPDRQNVRRQQCVHLSEYLSARNARLWQWRLHQVGVRVRNRYAVGRPAQIVSSALHRGFL
jgi:hypothetical protein